MAINLKSYLTPENSIIAGLATVALVIGNYNLHSGTVAQASMTEAGSTHMTTSTRKAGWTSLVMVSGISLIARDANVFILGCAAIIAMHSSYLHSIAVNPVTGSMNPAGSAPATLYAAA